MSKPEGGPVFPTGEVWPSGAHVQGMMLRDHFAGLALQGLLASSQFPVDSTTGNVTFEAYAKAAWHHADAMIAERDKP